MKRLALGATAIVVLALLAAGCGGGGSDALSKEDYVSQLNAICADLNAKQVEIGAPTSLEEFADKGAQILDEFNSAIDDVSDLNPPDELADQHDEFVSLGEQQRDLLSDSVDAANDGDQAKVEELGKQGDELDNQSDAIATEMGATECTK